MKRLYFYGSGEPTATTCGGDRRGWARGGTARLCADGSILERNSFVRGSVHRVDMRLQPDGRVQVIEVNPNPWLSSRAEFSMAARKSGRTYTQLVEEIVELAMARA